MARVALAYSGSLDTAICLHHLKEHQGLKVYTFTGNLGQSEYLEPLAEQAVELGATAAHLADLREKFAKRFIFPCIRANAVYEREDYLFAALTRPLIVEEIVNVALEEGCDCIAHGSRGIGNDLVRIENGIRALAPDLEILTPLKDLGLKGPKDEIAYAKAHGLPVESEKTTLYNVEQNIWGTSLQLRDMGDAWEEAPRDTYVRTVHPTEAPDRPVEVKIGFRKGVPVSVDGADLKPVKLIEKLNKIGGRCAVGRMDVVETRLNGDKTREIYEAPAAMMLHAAHRALESLTLEREVLHFKESLSLKYADLVFEGRWFLPVREGLDAFFQKIQEKVTGTVRLSLLKGNLSLVGRRAPGGSAPLA
ncbi:MAG: argininosuccinate synthase [Planctomycetota bacterium]